MIHYNLIFIITSISLFFIIMVRDYLLIALNKNNLASIKLKPMGNKESTATRLVVIKDP